MMLVRVCVAALLMAGAVQSAVAGPSTAAIRGTVEDAQGKPIKSVTVIAIGLGSSLTTDSGQFKIEVDASRVGDPYKLIVQAPGWVVRDRARLDAIVPKDAAISPLVILLDRPSPRPIVSRPTRTETPTVAAKQVPSRDLPLDVTHALVDLNQLEAENRLQCGASKHCLYLDLSIDGKLIYQRESDVETVAHKSVSLSLGHHVVDVNIGSLVPDLDPLLPCQSQFDLKFATDLSLSITAEISIGPSVKQGVPRRLVYAKYCDVSGY